MGGTGTRPEAGGEAEAARPSVKCAAPTAAATLPAAENVGGQAKPPHKQSPWPPILFATACVLYGAVVASHWSMGYIDFGDGNYLYISRRLAQGAVLYRDVLAPQPPLHLVTGWLLAKLSALAGAPMLIVVRAFSLLLHLAMACLAARLGGECARLAGRTDWARRCGAWAGTVYLMLPIGFWWSLGYQSEPLELIFLYGALLLILRHDGARSAFAAGIAAALATLTNMTAAPYALFFLVYLAVRERRRALPCLIGLAGLWLAVTAVMELTTGAYLENVIFNQVGSFPRREFLPTGENLLTYAWRKVLSEGTDVLNLEGGFVVLALLGLAELCSHGRRNGRTELLAWSCLAFMLSIVYVSKGGTMDYIFTIGEPAVAVLAALVLADVTARRECFRAVPLRRHTGLLAWGAALGAMGVAVWGPGAGFIVRTLGQKTYELDEYRTQQVVDLIRQNTRPGDMVLTPPFYAFLADRKIVEDYSEIFLWTLKYYNEKQDGVRGRGIETVERIAQALEKKAVRFVALDMDQTARIPEIRSAIERNYRPLRQNEFRTLNTRLMFYVPRE
jgi:hypothetical protein